MVERLGASRDQRWRIDPALQAWSHELWQCIPACYCTLGMEGCTL